MAYADRLVDPTRLRFGHAGDYVIELRHSLEGERYRPRRTAWSIKLDRPGDQAIGYFDDPCFRGRAEKYPGLLAGFHLPSLVVVKPPKPIQIPSHRDFYARRRRHLEFRADWLGLMKVHEYPPESRREEIHGSLFQFVDDEYVQVETDADGAVVLWSSNLTLPQMVKKLHESVGEPSPDDEGYVIDTLGRVTEASSAEVESLALDKQDAVRLFVASYRGGAISASWQRPRVKLRGGRMARAECSLSGEEISIDLLTSLVRETGTQHVIGGLEKSAQPLVFALGKTAVR